MLAHHVKEATCVSASVGGYVDHVHLLVGLSRTITIAKLVEQIKTETSKWAKRAIGGHSTFSWQAGYGAFSVSHSISCTGYFARCRRRNVRECPRVDTVADDH